MTKQIVDNLPYQIIGAAIEVRKDLGAGLLEKAYQRCMRHELLSLGLSVDFERNVNVIYKGLELETELRCDLVVNNLVVVEPKALQAIAPIHSSAADVHASLEITKRHTDQLQLYQHL